MEFKFLYLPCAVVSVNFYKVCEESAVLRKNFKLCDPTFVDLDDCS